MGKTDAGGLLGPACGADEGTIDSRCSARGVSISLRYGARDERHVRQNGRCVPGGTGTTAGGCRNDSGHTDKPGFLYDRRQNRRNCPRAGSYGHRFR
ncbi:hypothetical protein D3C86_1625570 [compost metagenome]